MRVKENPYSVISAINKTTAKNDNKVNYLFKISNFHRGVVKQSLLLKSICEI